jgi:hypothetical protein
MKLLPLALTMLALALPAAAQETRIAAVVYFVPAGHTAHLVRDITCEELDLSAIVASYAEPRGYPPDCI